MKKTLLFIALIMTTLTALPFSASANRVEQATEERAEGRAKGKLNRKERRAQFRADFQAFAENWIKNKENKEAKPHYGREVFIGSVLWLILGLVVAVTGLVLVFFGGPISIIGAAVLSVGLAIVLSFIIYRAVTGQL